MVVFSNFRHLLSQRFLRKNLFILAGFGVFSVFFAPAFSVAAEAQTEKITQLEPIVVTAEKREADIQKVPVSVSAITAQKLEDTGAVSLRDITDRVPNLHIVNWGMRGNTYVYVRGLGSINTQPAVGFYVDDVVYMDTHAFDTPLFDIERIEVLRGPQGTLYGRNTLGGAINIITKKPDNTTHAGIEQTVGNYKTSDSMVYLRTPIVEDKLFLGVSGRFEHRDGYTKNDYLNKDVDYREDWSGRGVLRWTPNEKLDVTWNVDGAKNHDGAFPITTRENVKDNAFHVDYDQAGKANYSSAGTSLRVSYDAPWATVTSISAYRGFNDVISNDQDFTPFNLLTAEQELVDRQFTQELRFTSPDDGRSTKWQGGLYYGHKKQDQRLDVNYNDDAVLMGWVPFAMRTRELSTVKYKSYAVFGQVTQTLFEKLDLTAGLRYDYERSKIDYTSRTNGAGMLVDSQDMNEKSSNGEWLPKFQIAYNWTPDFMTYASVAKGYRSGGFNTTTQGAAGIKYEGEKSWNYELGFKSAWFDKRLTFNGAFFYIDIEDMQVVQVLPNANTYLKNAGEARSYGLELESSFLITEGLTLDASFGYTNSEYTKYNDPVTGINYKGNRTPVAPDYTYSVGLQYRFPLVEKFSWFNSEKQDSLYMFTRAEVQGAGKSYWDDGNELRESPRNITNLRLGFETENMDLIFWTKNLFNERYNAVAFSRSIGELAQAGDPRTFGATLRIRF